MMISNPERTVLISSMGWVDHDALWRFDAATGKSDLLPIGAGAAYLTLCSSGSDHFSVVHHRGPRIELTVHHFADPLRVLARAALDDRGSSLEGDPSKWNAVPRLYAEFLNFEPWRDYVLVKISPSTGRIEVQRYAWYDSSYDKDYQGIVGVLELPGGDEALVSVQRSSQLIVHDLKTGMKNATIKIGGGLGNPRLQIRNAGAEVWASDYDALVVLDGKTRRVLRRARLQDAARGTGLFIGDYSFSSDERICLVARPYSGDVVGIDAAGMKIRFVSKLGRQPLEAMALAGGNVVARDWKTGDVLRGTLSPL